MGEISICVRGATSSVSRLSNRLLRELRLGLELKRRMLRLCGNISVWPLAELIRSRRWGRTPVQPRLGALRPPCESNWSGGVVDPTGYAAHRYSEKAQSGGPPWTHHCFPWPDLLAHREALRLPASKVVEKLVEIVGGN